jgi:hypothetical protein
MMQNDATQIEKVQKVQSSQAETKSLLPFYGLINP